MPPHTRQITEPVRHLRELTAWQRLVLRQHRVVSRQQALRHLSSAAIRHRLASGAWQAPVRAIYVAHSGPITSEQRLIVAALAVGAGRPAVLAGATALTLLGLRWHHTRDVHILLPWQRRSFATLPGVIVHRTRHLPTSDRDARVMPPHTLAARSLVDAAQWAKTDDEAAAVIAAGYQQQLVYDDAVIRVLEGMPRVHRRRLIWDVALDAAGGSHSLPEVEFVRGCRAHRLPLPNRQVMRRDRRGRQRYLDAYFEEYGVHVEIDGGQHTNVRHWWADMRRQNELWLSGDIVLRFPAYVVRRQPHQWVPQLRAALMAGGWTPS